MADYAQMSLLEVAVSLMEQKKTKQPILDLIKEVLEIKGEEDADGRVATQLYIDITTSSKFVFLGEGEWDLKSRQSLEEYDKDGSAFNSKEDEYVDEDDELEDNLDTEDLESYDDDEDDEDLDDEDRDDDEDYEDEFDDDDEDYEDDPDAIIDGENIERYDEDDDFNEDAYNDYMDAYEDMYEE